jgi:hypothetical protein
MLDGRFIAVGEVVDGMILSAVDTEARVAVFAGPAGEVRVPLPLPRPEASENGHPAGAAK